MNHVGINIMGNTLQLVGVVEKNKIYYLENVDEELFSETLDFQSSDFINVFQTAFDNLTQRNQIKSDKISVALPIDLFKIFSFPLEPQLSGSDLQKQIEWEFSVLFPTLSFKDHIIRQKKISSGLYSYPEAMIIAVDQNPAREIYNFLLQNDLVLQFIDNAHFASDLLIKKNNTISVYVGGQTVSFFTYKNNELTGYRKFVTDNNTKLIDHINTFASQGENGFSEFYIAGDIEFSQLQKEIEESVNINFNNISPFERIQLSESFVQNDHYLNKAKLFSSAAGICFRIA
ncbi:hypothetical protein MNBD_IGNAVI01-1700 [hydrothermal vent metagenome]|uniref:Type IV pilus biogenesis protein PilM n=1 Tax=hydrothermal vent metagenome TaxID=652676 RepID=A0A3B1BXK3_9ZZZZ